METRIGGLLGLLSCYCIVIATGMPRSYKRTTNRQTWTKSQLATARHEVDCGMSVRATAAKYGIPRTTLIRRMAAPSMSMNMGPKDTVFTEAQENELVQHLLDLESRFYGITQKDVQKLAFELAERNFLPHPFNKSKKMAGRDWVLGFLKRNSTISFRKPEATSAARARGFNKPAVYTFYGLLEKCLEDGGFDPAQIFNADETGISTVPPKKQKIAALKGKKQVGSISSAERGETTSVMMCMSATGQYLPPFMIFPRARMNEALKRGAPAGTKYRCNASGYMTTEVFLDWFDHFLEYAKPSKETPVLLIIDGHSSHTKNFAFAEKAKNNFVTVLVLPPHCSNKMQPLDVAFMGPFKKNYSNAADAFLRQHPGVVIGLYDVADLMAQAFVKAASTSVAIAGFKASGIWPCNRHVFPDESFAPSEVTAQPELLPDVEPGISATSSVVKETVVEAPLVDSGTPVDQADSVMESSFNVTPEEILPLPKIAGPRSSKRKRKTEKAVEITSDTYRQELAVAEAAKEIKLIKKKKRPIKRSKQETVPEDTLCDQCGNCFSDSVDGSGWGKCITCGIWFHEMCHHKKSICSGCA